MQKDFDRWNLKKKHTHEHTTAPFYNEREIWWCRLGINIGTEQDGSIKEFSRPALILKGFGAQTCFVVPLTTSKNKHPLRIGIGKVDGFEASALLSQIRVISTKRLVRKIQTVNTSTYFKIRNAVRDLF